MRTLDRIPARGALALFLVMGPALLLPACSGDEELPGASPASTPASAPADPAVQPARPAVAPAAQTAREVYQNGELFALRGDLDRAIEEYRRALVLDPDLAEAHYALGKTLVHNSYVVVGSADRDQEVLAEGIASLRRAAELDPESAEYAYWTGRALSIKDENAQAIEWLRKAIALDGTYGAAYKRLGLVLMEEGHSEEEAKEAFLAALETLPDDAGIHFQLGNLQKESPEAAAAAYRRSIELDPTRPSAYSNLANMLAELGDEEGAEEARASYQRWKSYDDELQKLLLRASQERGNGEILLRVGEMYYAVGKWSEAADWFRQSLVADATNPLTHYYRGVAMRHLEDYEVAMNHQLEAAFLDQDVLEPHLELIRLFALMEDDAQLQDKLTQLDEELDPGQLEQRAAIAEALLDVGRTEEAAERYQAILDADPGNELAKAGLARSRDGR